MKLFEPEKIELDPSEREKVSVLDPCNPKHNAAIKLQILYKSFCIIRRKLIDFAELNRSSISFFDSKKHETAISRWSRARTRAAKVGKGLSKSNKGQKLVLQHWLEAIDPRHRYGHNLHLYYKEWLGSDSREPFLYWLDIGEGKGKDLVHCPRSTLHHQCINYLGPLERKAYEISLEGGKFLFKQSREPLHTTEEYNNVKWIFVVSTSKIIYAAKKIKGSFQHSSFLAGGAALAAGRLLVEHGTLKAIWPHSGHYRPNKESFKDLLLFLAENKVDLTHVQVTPMDEEETSLTRQETPLRSSSFKEVLTRKMDGSGAASPKRLQEKTDFCTTNLSKLPLPKTIEISPLTHLIDVNCRRNPLLWRQASAWPEQHSLSGVLRIFQQYSLFLVRFFSLSIMYIVKYMRYYMLFYNGKIIPFTRSFKEIFS